MRTVIRVIATDCGDVTVSITYKKLKNLNMRVRNGEVAITCPRSFSYKQIDDIVRKRAAWIVKSLAAVPREDVVYYLGIPLERVDLTGDKSGCVMEGGRLTVTVKPDKSAGDVVKQWLKKEAARVITPMFDEVCGSAFRDVPKPDIAFRVMRSRWGSANVRSRKITFSASLVCLPPELIGLIIAHELTHFLHADHSPAFHAELERRWPNARQLERELKAFGPLI